MLPEWSSGPSSNSKPPVWTARTGSAALALGLDGTVVLEATADDALGNGAAGLQAYDTAKGESADRFLIAWHSFEVAPAEA